MNLNKLKVKKWLRMENWSERTIQNVMSKAVGNEIPISVLAMQFGTAITDEIYTELTKEGYLKWKPVTVQINPKWDKVYKITARHPNSSMGDRHYDAILVKQTEHHLYTGPFEPDDKFVIFDGPSVRKTLSLEVGEMHFHILGVTGDRIEAYVLSKMYEDYRMEMEEAHGSWAEYYTK